MLLPHHISGNTSSHSSLTGTACAAVVVVDSDRSGHDTTGSVSVSVN